MKKLPQLFRGQFLVFVAASAVIFVLSLSAANTIGFVPYYIDGTPPTHEDSIALRHLPELGEEITATLPSQPEAVQPTPGVEPTRVIIKEIGLDLPVSNPETRNLEELDEVLKKGPARYVDSALLGEEGNVLIFGHSSHLPVVVNQMYKAFNKIPELEAGDVVTVRGGNKEFTYHVTSITQVDAEEGIIDLRRDGQKLTIVTCDTLTSKSSRFVLEAELVGSYEL